MIRITIDISKVTAGPKNELGAGVLVRTDPINLNEIPEAEGVTWAGICMAINDYMRSRGCPEFDCTRQMHRA